MNDKVTLQLLDQATADVTIPIKIGKINGSFIGEAIIRSKQEMQEMQDEVVRLAEEAEAQGKTAADRDPEEDEAMLRRLYAGFRGLGDNSKTPITGDDAFTAICRGKYSSYLLPAAITAYYQQYGAALQQNLPKRRWR